MSDVQKIDVREDLSRAVRSLWWLVLLRGLLLIVMGVYALMNPLLTTVVFAQLAGIYLLVDGVSAIYIGLTGQTDSRLWAILRGVLLILLGLFAIGNPMIVAFFKTTFLVVFVAIGTILSGIVEIYSAIRDRKEIQGEGWLILGGILDIAFGVILLFAPFAAGLFFVRIFGAFAIVAGVSMIVAAFKVRRTGKEVKSLFQSR
ncbi:MAG: HdeD family acid-resistance protein [Planctomycetota bacterium]|nr:HdeD family acid-resistance protein [Planctomycetota bacterium]